jgi:multidrug efflux pump
MKLSDTAIRRPVLASMLSVALVLFGVLGYRELSVREFPDVDPPIISVSTTLRGANPRVMESAVTDVLEEELSSVEGLRTMTSSSSEQSSNITLEFQLDRDVEAAAQDVRDKVSRVRGRLPEEIEEPVVSKQDADARPVMFISLTSETHDLMQLTDLANRIVKKRLQTIPGVARADLRGERRYSMRVWLSASALASRGLTVQDAMEAIRSRNVEVPAGRIESSRREFTVRSLGELKTPSEFSDLVINAQGNQIVRLRDVGTVELGPENDRSVFRTNGRPSIGVTIQRQSKANLVEIANHVRAAIPEVQAMLPAGVRAELGYDQSVFVIRSIKEAQETLVIAGRSRGAHHLPVPAELPRDHHPRSRHSGLDHRHLRDHGRAGFLDQQPDAAGTHPRHRHRGRRRDHRAGECLPAPGRAGEESRAGRHRRQQ